MNKQFCSEDSGDSFEFKGELHETLRLLSSMELFECLAISVFATNLVARKLKQIAPL